MTPLEKTIAQISPADADCQRRAREYIATLTMPYWALGRILDLAVELAGMTGSLTFSVERKSVVVMAGDHGVVNGEDVSRQPQEVTMQMMRNFASGGGAVSVLSRLMDARVVLVDMGVNGDLSDLVAKQIVLDRKIARGTQNFTKGPAMSRAEAIQSVETGIELAQNLAGATDIFATGEMGIGNTTPSSAIVTVLAGADDPLPFVDRGASLPESMLEHKADVIRRGIARNRPDASDALDVLSKVGGFEIGGIAGIILGAARMHRPVLVDGFISSAGALIAQKLAPAAADYMILSHGSQERGHRKMAELLGKKPLLDLNMRLGEGTGAVMAMPLLAAASAILREMTTFGGAGVDAAGTERK